METFVRWLMARFGMLPTESEPTRTQSRLRLVEQGEESPTKRFINVQLWVYEDTAGSWRTEVRLNNRIIASQYALTKFGHLIGNHKKRALRKAADRLFKLGDASSRRITHVRDEGWKKPKDYIYFHEELAKVDTYRIGDMV
jgi:hypothetical protein